MKDQIKRNFILSVAAIIMVFGLLTAGFFAYRACEEREARKNSLLFLHDDGTFAAVYPDKIIKENHLKESISKLKQERPRKEGTKSVETFLNVKADPEARTMEFTEVLEICKDRHIDIIRLSETDANIYYEIPVAMKIFLIYSYDEDLERVVLENGTVAVKITPRPIPREVEAPDLGDLYIKILWLDAKFKPIAARYPGQAMSEYLKEHPEG